MPNFVEHIPTTESIWRSIVLFGRNVASYKFALARSLLELAEQEQTFIKLEDLASPFTAHLLEHLSREKKQGTFKSSKFLNACKEYSDQKISRDDLIAKTVSLGFNNVIDAFHVVGEGEVPIKFFKDERSRRGGITLTDDLILLKEKIQFINLPAEVESRWNLVETAWSLDMNPKLLEIKHDHENGFLYTESNKLRRVDVTSSRNSLNGYQKGKCFYCFKEIILIDGDKEKMAEIEHFFPHTLINVYPDINFNGIWNLVLSCRDCNRGENGKLTKIPENYLLERLSIRNEFLIQSHHPLRDTIMKQTGKTPSARVNFLNEKDKLAITYLIHRWAPKINQGEVG